MSELMDLTAEYQNVWNKVNEMMDVSYGCAESFVAAVGEYLWGDVDDSIKMISTGFSGGVGGSHEELCGGVSGAAIIIGLLYGRTTNDEAMMVKCKRLISEHRDRFVQEFGTTTCQELRDAEFGSDEKNPCSALIAPAAFMLLDILEEEKEREKLAVELANHVECADVLPLNEFKEQFQEGSLEVLLAELERIDLPHDHRNWIGDQINKLGDGREGIGILTDNLPDIKFLPVPGGSLEIERAGKFDVNEFLISKYPITSLQFEVFLDDPDGFKNPEWWESLGVKSEQLAGAGEQRFRSENYPRDNVSWFDAVAFCRWLNHQLLTKDDRRDLPVLDYHRK